MARRFCPARGQVSAFSGCIPLRVRAVSSVATAEPWLWLGTRAQRPRASLRRGHGDPDMTPKIARFLAERNPPTPCLVVDLDVIGHNYKRLKRALPLAEIYYAVKANPAPEVLRLLDQLGSKFDTA